MKTGPWGHAWIRPGRRLRDRLPRARPGRAHAERTPLHPGTRAVQLSERPWLVFTPARYEGIDRRVIDEYATRMPVYEVSIGDYVLVAERRPYSSSRRPWRGCCRVFSATPSPTVTTRSPPAPWPTSWRGPSTPSPRSGAAARSPECWSAVTTGRSPAGAATRPCAVRRRTGPTSSSKRRDLFRLRQEGPRNALDPGLAAGTRRSILAQTRGRGRIGRCCLRRPGAPATGGHDARPDAAAPSWKPAPVDDLWHQRRKQDEMSHLLDSVDSASLRSDIPAFRPGDTVDVDVRVIEGNRSRVQQFKGVVIRRQGAEGLRDLHGPQGLLLGRRRAYLPGAHPDRREDRARHPW